MKSTRNPNPPPPPEIGSKRAFKEVKKSSQLQIRIEEDLKEKLSKAAKASGLSISAYILAAAKEKMEGV